MEDLKKFAIGSIVSAISVYVILFVVGMAITQAGSQLPLSADHQSDLDKKAADNYGFLMFVVTFPGKEMLTFFFAFIGGLGCIMRK